MLGVERFSFLPNLQGDGGDLARQGQTRHLRPRSFLQQPKVKLVKNSLTDASRVGCALEHVLQFVVVIPVQPANPCRSFLALHLSFNHAVLGAVAGLQRQSAVSPELALGAEPVRRLHPRDQHRRTQRTQKWHRLQPLGRRVLPALDDQVVPRLAAQLLQGVQLLVKALGSTPQSASAERCQILSAVVSVQLPPRADNRLAAKHGLQSPHHTRGVFGEHRVTARQLLNLQGAGLAVIDRGQQPRAQKLGQLACVDRVPLVARLQQGVLARVAHHQLLHPPRQKVVKPGRMRSFLEGDVQRSPHSADEIQNRRRPRHQHRLLDQSAAPVKHRRRNRVPVNIESYVSNVVHLKAPSSLSGSRLESGEADMLLMIDQHPQRGWPSRTRVLCAPRSGRRSLTATAAEGTRASAWFSAVRSSLPRGASFYNAWAMWIQLFFTLRTSKASASMNCTIRMRKRFL